MARPARKREDVLTGAARVFRRLGYGQSSMDAVAQEAGVSKATLYRYFPTKMALFVAAIQATPPARLEFAPPTGDIDEVLTMLGTGVLRAVNDESYLGLFRIALGESERFPELAQAVRSQVFERVFPAVQRLMEGCVAAGKLRPLDTQLAAEEFIAMIMSFVIIKVIAFQGVGWTQTDAQVVNQVVSVFLHGAATDETRQALGAPRETLPQTPKAARLPAHTIEIE